MPQTKTKKQISPATVNTSSAESQATHASKRSAFQTALLYGGTVLTITVIVVALFFSLRMSDNSKTSLGATLFGKNDASVQLNQNSEGTKAHTSDSQTDEIASASNQTDGGMQNTTSESSISVSSDTVTLYEGQAPLQTPVRFESNTVTNLAFVYPDSWKISEKDEKGVYSISLSNGSHTITLSSYPLKSEGFIGAIPCGKILQTVGSFYKIQTDEMNEKTNTRELKTVFVHKNAVNNFGEYFSIDRAIDYAGYDINPLIARNERNACFIPNETAMRVAFASPRLTADGSYNTTGFFSLTVDGEITKEIDEIISTVEGIAPY